MKSRNFGQFLTPPIPPVFLPRPLDCRHTIIDPRPPPKTGVSFFGRPQIVRKWLLKLLDLICRFQKEI